MALVEQEPELQPASTLRESLAKLGITPEIGSTPATAGAYIRAEMARWKPVIDALGVKLTD